VDTILAEWKWSVSAPQFYAHGAAFASKLNKISALARAMVASVMAGCFTLIEMPQPVSKCTALAAAQTRNLERASHDSHLLKIWMKEFSARPFWIA
jgi:hypothetical protein